MSAIPFGAHSHHIRRAYNRRRDAVLTTKNGLLKPDHSNTLQRSHSSNGRLENMNVMDMSMPLKQQQMQTKESRHGADGERLADAQHMLQKVTLNTPERQLRAERDASLASVRSSNGGDGGATASADDATMARPRFALRGGASALVRHLSARRLHASEPPLSVSLDCVALAAASSEVSSRSSTQPGTPTSPRSPFAMDMSAVVQRLRMDTFNFQPKDIIRAGLMDAFQRLGTSPH